jgi:hypothetical protein
LHFAQVRLDLFRKLPLNIFESLSNGRNGKHRQQVQPSSCLARPAPHAMGIPDELLVDQRQISPALRCVICTEVFVEPVASGSNTCLEQTISCCFCLSNGRYADHLGLPSKKGHEWTSGVFFSWHDSTKVMSTCLLLVLHQPSFGKQSRMSVVQRRDACLPLETVPTNSSAGG